VLLKIGSYGLVRFIEVFYRVRLRYSWVIFSRRIVGRIIVRVLCLVQIDIKSMVAYSSVVHINLMLCRLITFLKRALVGAYTGWGKSMEANNYFRNYSFFDKMS
ncbi:NADH-ubiquinone oxidoreductase chain 4, partial [Trachymyrmex cornetzi]